jgi:hypothetical protein
LSDSGNVVSLTQLPPRCPAAITLPGPPDIPYFDYCAADDLQPCEGPECEWRILRYAIATDQLIVTHTPVRDAALPGRVGEPQFSANGRWLLYPRQVRYPFGGTDEIQSLTTTLTCLDRTAIDSGSGAVAVTCEDLGPALPGAVTPSYVPPTIWTLRNLDTGLEVAASVHSDGFQSTRALLSDDGATAVYQSRDPRLRHDPLTGISSLDESLLPDACFWPDGPDAISIRAVTNDNTQFVTTATQYRYPELPVICPAPAPVLEGQVFASELLVRVRAPVAVRSSGGAFGLLLVPLSLLALWRSRQSEQ